MTTVADIDAQLDETRKAFTAAIDKGDAVEAERLYLELDQLLDLRCHTPHDS